MDEEGKELGSSTFPNTLPGAKALESQLLQIMKEKGFSTRQLRKKLLKNVFSPLGIKLCALMSQYF